MQSPQILIIDLGSQYTLVIGRILRELGFRSIILSPNKAEEWLKNNKPKGIILSGGSSSVYEENAPSPPKEILELGAPILGICYGMQWLAQQLGGFVVANRDNKEYGKTKIFFSCDDPLFSEMYNPTIAWASHGDSVSNPPIGFQIIARSASTSNNKATCAGISSNKLKIWGIQFHPEVKETEQGHIIIKNFITRICKCEMDWKPQDIITNIRQEVAASCKGKAIIGFSGGVDSSTLSKIIAPVLKDDLLAVCIDTGALRENEIQEIKENAEATGVNLKVVKAHNRFQEVLEQAVDAELKRRHFKKLYGIILEEMAKEFKAEYIVQGSLATDFIESGSVGKAALIKSHHNIGLNLTLKELHPLHKLFKYEIRELANVLGLPKSISERQPFPGPGLFIRVIGKPPTLDRLNIVRWADAEVTRILKKQNLYCTVSQLVVALICSQTVGVKGDRRVYANSILVRGVRTSDFMTARGYQFPAEVRGEIIRCLTKHPEIVRVWFDETDKPPATTEFE